MSPLPHVPAPLEFRKRRGGAVSLWVVAYIVHQPKEPRSRRYLAHLIEPIGGRYVRVHASTKETALRLVKEDLVRSSKVSFVDRMGGSPLPDSLRIELKLE